MTDLGPMTEKRFEAAFAETAVITRRAAAKLIGVDEKTLDGLSDDGVVRAVRRGAHRAYTERDLRAYLAEGPDVECRSTSPKRAASGSTISSSKVVAFTDRPARLRGVQRRPSSARGV